MATAFETIAVRLPKALKEKLVKRAKKAGLNSSIVLRGLITNYLKEVTDASK